MPDLDIPAEFLAEDAQARKRFEEEQASERLVQRLRAEDLAQEDLPNVSEERAKELDDLMMRMTETDWLTLMMQVGSNPALARELLGADVNEENFIERMNAVKEKKKRALADLRYRALKGKPMKKSEVTQMMRNLVKNQWCAAHNGTITMKDVKAMNKPQLIEEYENICRCLEKDRLLSAQYNLFRPKPAITEPPSKRQRVERVSSQPASVPAATTLPADDPDSAGGGSYNLAGGAFGAKVTDSTVTTTAAMDSAGSRRTIGVSPFADSVADPSPFLSSIAGGPSPSNVSTDHVPIDVLFESTSGGINEFFLESDEEEQIGMSRVAADPDSDDEVLAEIIFRGKSISADGVVLVDKLPDDEIVDPRVKVETVSESASSPPRSRRKHLGVRSDDFLWDKPVEDFFSSESESDDDMENYIPPLPYGAFKDWEIVSCPLGNTYYHVYYQENRRRKCFTFLKELLPHVYREDLLLLRRRMNRYFRLNPEVDVGLDLWRDVNMLCQSLHSDDVEDFWRTQDEWIVCSWKLYPKSSVHVLDLTNGKTVYMFVDKFYPIRATLLERMLRHRLTVPPSYCRDIVVAGNIIQTVQDGLRQAYECIASAPLSPWLTAKKESGSPLQTALVCNSNPLIALASPEQTATGKDVSNPLYGCDGLPKTVRVFQFTLDSRSEKLDWFLLHQDWKLLFFEVATSFDSAVHRVHAVSFDAAALDVASAVSAACIVAAGYIVSAGICDAAEIFVSAGSSSSVPADYVPAGHYVEVERGTELGLWSGGKHDGEDVQKIRNGVKGIGGFGKFRFPQGVKVFAVHVLGGLWKFGVLAKNTPQAYSIALLQYLIDSLHHEFDMTDLGALNYFLEPHLAALKRILRYVHGTLDLGLHLYESSTTSLVGYTDTNWAGCPSTCRSTLGNVVTNSRVTPSWREIVSLTFNEAGVLHVNWISYRPSAKRRDYYSGSENRPPMLNKENYVPWSSRLLRYAKSRPNGKLIYNSIMNGPYVRRMIPEPGDPARTVPVPETFHEQTDDELTEA
ncbi:reverse transcriptase domain-containing protein [Tanacetum coccineum]